MARPFVQATGPNDYAASQRYWDSDATAPIRAHHAARPGFHCSSHMRPAIICGVICVIVDLRLRDLEKRAWDFVTGFAHDNNLIMLEYCQFVGGGLV